jgi:GTP-binding protein
MHREPPSFEYFRRARFALSVQQLADLPADRGREVAFVGRSNVGKSSVINVLCDRHGLARTSRTPGRTQHFVLFDLGGERRLVDLPGFGYAAVSKVMRAHWERTIPRYLERRRSLAGLVLIADARHELRAEECHLVAWTLAAGVPLRLLLNKADKLGRQAQLLAERAAAAVITAAGGDARSVRLFSAVTGLGVEELRATLDAWFGAERGGVD